MPKTLPALLLAIATLATPATSAPQETEPAPAPEPTPTPAPPAAQTWPCEHYLGTWIITNTNELLLITRTSFQVGSTVMEPAECVEEAGLYSLQINRSGPGGDYNVMTFGTGLSMHSRDGRTELTIGDSRLGNGALVRAVEKQTDA